MSIGLDPG